MPVIKLSSPQSYFCGHDPYCNKFGSVEALAQAKANIDEHYTAVIVLEDLENGLCLLKAKIPQFYGGIVQEYQGMKAPGMFQFIHLHALLLIIYFLYWF